MSTPQIYRFRPAIENYRMDEKPKRRFRFSLRTLLAAAVPLCAALAWWVSYSREWTRQRHEALSCVDTIFENVVGDPEGVKSPWALRIFGEEGIPTMFIDPTTPIRADDARSLFPEADVVEVKRRPDFFH